VRGKSLKMLNPETKVLAVRLAKISSVLVPFFAVCLAGAQHAIHDAIIPKLELKDGRVFSEARVVSQSQTKVLIRYEGGASNVEKVLLPDSILAQVDPQLFESIKAKELDIASRS
jgi:hypothetical protein